VSAARKAPAARRLGRPPASSSAETRQRIVDVARERFATLGYATTSNKDIAHAAGITTGAIYHYFESKRDLYLAVFDEVEQLVFTRFKDALAESDGGFLDKLDRVLAEAVAINRDDPTVASFFVAVAVEAQRNEELAGLDRTQGIDAARFFGDLVREGYEKGEISGDVEPGHVTNALMAIASGLAQFSSLVQNRNAHAETTAVLMQIFRGELFAVPRKRRGRR
jgi:AcrR family transcriptional regulator